MDTKKDNTDFQGFNIETDGTGMPVLQVEGENRSVLKKGTAKTDESEFATDDDIENAGGNRPIVKSTGNIEQASRPKLSKNGLSTDKQPVVTNKQPVMIKKEEIIKPAEINTIGDAAIKHLIESANKSKQSIKFEIQIDAIDKDLFAILNKSYKDKSEQIINIIIESNEEIIRSKINTSIKEYYEIKSEEDQ